MGISRQVVYGVWGGVGVCGRCRVWRIRGLGWGGRVGI